MELRRAELLYCKVAGSWKPLPIMSSGIRYPEEVVEVADALDAMGLPLQLMVPAVIPLVTSSLSMIATEDDNPGIWGKSEDLTIDRIVGIQADRNGEAEKWRWRLSEENRYANDFMQILLKMPDQMSCAAIFCIAALATSGRSTEISDCPLAGDQGRTLEKLKKFIKGIHPDLRIQDAKLWRTPVYIGIDRKMRATWSNLNPLSALMASRIAHCLQSVRPVVLHYEKTPRNAMIAALIEENAKC